MKHGYVISDLHLFAHRSTGHEHHDAIHAAAKKVDFIVLNGDIFDFHWSTVGTLEESLHAAKRYLRALVKPNPRCKLFYVLGNHDGLDLFLPALESLAETYENFTWFPSHLRINGLLFLHGDLILSNAKRDPFVRPITPPKPTKGKAAHLAYRSVVAMRLHRPVANIHRPRYCAKRILRALATHDPSLREGLHDIYFGHTHSSFEDFEHEGIRFHNTGAAVRHLDCNLLKVKN